MKPHEVTATPGIGQYLALLATACLVPISFIDAPYPLELSLQHVPTVAILVVLTVSIRHAWISAASCWCILGFLWLHMLGARWIYSFVPYDEWTRAILGTSISEYAGWQRNHYDRLVHLAFGILGVPPAAELLRRFGGMRPLGAAVMSIATVLALGAMYEIAEWQVAVWLAPDHAEAYNGQQGDMWDPQKDMALAWLGATISALVLAWPRQVRPQD